VQLAALVVDLGPEPPGSVVLPPAPHGAHPSAAKLAALTLADEAAAVATAAGHAVETFEHDAVRAARHPLAVVGSGLATARSVGRFVAPVTRQYSKLLGSRSTNRLVA